MIPYDVDASTLGFTGHEKYECFALVCKIFNNSESNHIIYIKQEAHEPHRSPE